MEGVGDAVHAADGLEHGGLPVDHFFGHHALPEIGVEQRVHGQRIDGDGILFAGARRDLEAGALGAFEKQVGLQIAVLHAETRSYVRDLRR